MATEFLEVKFPKELGVKSRYFVSENGDEWFSDKNPTPKKPYIMKNKKYILQACVCINTADGRHIPMNMAKLVLWANEIYAKDDEKWVLHLDSNVLNNTLANLKWSSTKENHSHCDRTNVSLGFKKYWDEVYSGKRERIVKGKKYEPKLYEKSDL